jgi:hypothetical protein
MKLIRLAPAFGIFALGALFGATVFGFQQPAPPFPAGDGPVIEQTAYYAKPGTEQKVYEHRIHASDVRQKIGLPRGRIWRRVGGTGDLPDVIWQVEYTDQDALKRDLDARAKSPEFEQVRSVMNTLIARFSRGFYQPATP